MNVAWHIVRKDLARLKWILALWVVVLIGGLALATIQAGLDADTYLPFHIAAQVVMSGFGPLITFGLVMGLLHDDPVADVDAFWITRPISGESLLAAKAIAWILLGLLPVVVMLPFWLSHDFGWQLIASAAQQSLGTHFLIAIVALPFAVVSANGSKFVMHVILGAAGLGLLTLLTRLGNASGERASASELTQSKAWIIALLWFVAVLIVTLNQFLRRRSRQSWMALAVAVAIGFAVAKAWPWKLGFVVREPAASSSQPDRPHGLARIRLNLEGETKPLVVVAEVPLREGERKSHGGSTLYVQSVLLDYTGELQVSFSEATPNASGRFHDLLPGSGAPQRAAEYYFIRHRDDGRALVIKPNRGANELNVASLRFSHSSVATRPANGWQGGAPPNLKAWLKDAVLAKAVAEDSAGTQSVTAATSFHP
jgi:hypothetical protein